MDWVFQIFDPDVIRAFFASFQSELADPAFWVRLSEIMWINLLLSGDNALVIAMACRALEPRQRFWGMVLGALAAVLLRIIFTGIVVELMTLPYLKLAGGLALIVIAVKLVTGNDEEENVRSGANIWSAVQIVVVADIIMSLDNVIAVAAASGGSIPLLVLGLALSIPVIIGGAAIIMKALERLPVLVWIGALLLGWVAGQVIATDVVVQPWLHSMFAGELGQSFDRGLASIGLGARFAGGERDGAEYLFGLFGALVVLTIASTLHGMRRGTTQPVTRV